MAYIFRKKRVFGNNISLQPKSDFICTSQISPISVKTQAICAKTQANSKKTQVFSKKTQRTRGFSLFDPPKKRDKKKPEVKTSRLGPNIGREL